MSIYSTMQRTRLEKQLASVQAALDALYTSRLQSVSSNVESYSIDSGEGAQRVTRKKDAELDLRIEKLEAQEQYLINQLSGKGLISIQLRRRTPYDQN
jgi:hypothetical protein